MAAPRPHAGALLCALVTLAVVAGARCSWSEQSSKVAPFLRGISFTDANNGWVAGFGSRDAPGAILYSSDQGRTWNSTHIEQVESYLYSAVDVSRDSPYAIAAGVGLLRKSGISVSADGGATWIHDTSVNLESFFVDAGVVPGTNGSSMFAVGQWVKIENVRGEGVALSSDHGKLFTHHDWGMGVRARYGSFVNANFGFVTGGKYPSFSFSVLDRSGAAQRVSAESILRVSSRIGTTTSGALAVVPEDQARAAVDRTYTGIIARTDDRGLHFHLMHNATLYGQNVVYNGISCVDTNRCWVVAEGYNVTSDKHGGYIFYTPNNGLSWMRQLYEEHVSFVRVRMLNDQVGWAIGGQIPSLTILSGVFYQTTDGGKTWKKQTHRDVIPFDISIIDDKNAYAVALSLKLETKILRYHAV